LHQICPAQSDRTQVAIVDAFKIRRAGLLKLLGDWAQSKDVDLVGVEPGSDLSGGPDGARQCGMAILSIGGAEMETTEVQQWIDQICVSAPQAALVIVSDHDEPEQVVAAFRGGARGFIHTGLEPSIALQSLSFILSGGTFFPPTALNAPRSELAIAVPARRTTEVESSYTRAGALTTRQRQVLTLLRTGKSNKLIARELSMQESTVKVHVRQIMRKFGAANRTQVAISAIETSGSLLAEEAPGGLLAFGTSA
jgi:DNA-binding NarL/FixJ family response regulator